MTAVTGACHLTGRLTGIAGEAEDWEASPSASHSPVAEAGDDDGVPPPPPSAPHPDEQVAAALHRIRGHIGSARKFPKASALLRQLLVGSALSRPAHGDAAFGCLRAAMADPANVRAGTVCTTSGSLLLVPSRTLATAHEMK